MTFFLLGRVLKDATLTGGAYGGMKNLKKMSGKELILYFCSPKT